LRRRRAFGRIRFVGACRRCLSPILKALSFEAESVWLQSLGRQMHQFRKLGPMSAGTQRLRIRLPKPNEYRRVTFLDGLLHPVRGAVNVRAHQMEGCKAMWCPVGLARSKLIEQALCPVTIPAAH
jgi:hypothetical protein